MTRWLNTKLLPALLGLLFFCAEMGRAAPVDETIREAYQAARQGYTKFALGLANRAVKEAPRYAPTYLLRGTLHDTMKQFDKAVEDFSKAIELEDDLTDAYDRRGSCYFKLGKFKESLFDFDKFLEMKPQEGPGHWRRGITCYYAGAYAEGRDQFKAYEQISTMDVENAAWHLLCAAHVDGLEAARKSLLKVRGDRRVPLMVAYELFAGRATPDDVLKAIDAGSPSEVELKSRRFYGHLYLGLYYEMIEDKANCLKHIRKAAVDYSNPGYMGDVARVHLKWVGKVDVEQGGLVE